MPVCCEWVEGACEAIVCSPVSHTHLPLSLSLAPSMASSSTPHALLLPFPLIGHINPMLQFAHCLASSGVFVTLAFYQHPPSRVVRRKILSLIAQFNDHALPPQPQQQQCSRIRVLVLPHGLSDHQKHGADFELITETIREMATELQMLVERLNSQEQPQQQQRISCIVCDTGFPWAQDVADKCGVPRVDFNTSSAASYLLNVSLPVLLSKGYFRSAGQNGVASTADEGCETMSTCIPALHWLRVADVPEEFSRLEFMRNFAMETAARGKEAEWVIINTCYELESEAVDALRAHGLRLLPCGPLFSHSLERETGMEEKASNKSSAPASDECLIWLDTHRVSSVLYVALGTNSSWSTAELQAIAHGLEGSKQPFLWAIRPEAAEAAGASIDEVLPEGFRSRTKGRGLLVPWADQSAILSHEAVGGFLTHCGWNSTMESVYMGVPMLGWPKAADQMLNMRMIVELWGVGMEVRKEDVEGGMRELMQGERGREVRERALQTKQVVRESVEDVHFGSSHTTLNKFIHHIKQPLGNPTIRVGD